MEGKEWWGRGPQGAGGREGGGESFERRRSARARASFGLDRKLVGRGGAATTVRGVGVGGSGSIDLERAFSGGWDDGGEGERSGGGGGGGGGFLARGGIVLVDARGSVPARFVDLPRAFFPSAPRGESLGRWGGAERDLAGRDVAGRQMREVRASWWRIVGRPSVASEGDGRSDEGFFGRDG